MIPFTTNLPLSSKVWIYQSNRAFTQTEIEKIKPLLNHFVDSWDSHGVRLKGDYKIILDQFIILMVDDSAESAGGCSIDRSVGVIRNIESEIEVTLLDNSQVAYQNNDEIKTTPLNTIKSHIESGEITKETTIFNNTVTSVSELQENWQQPAKNSWCSRFFK